MHGFDIFCFFEDALRRPARDLNFGGFGLILGPFLNPLDLYLKACWHFFRHLCAVGFLLEFCWILGAGLGGQGGADFTLEGSPTPAFSDIRGQKQRFRLRRVAFSGFLGYLLP